VWSKPSGKLSEHSKIPPSLSTFEYDPCSQQALLCGLYKGYAGGVTHQMWCHFQWSVFQYQYIWKWKSRFSSKFCCKQVLFRIGLFTIKLCIDRNCKWITSGDCCTTFDTFSTHYTVKSRNVFLVFKPDMSPCNSQFLNLKSVCVYVCVCSLVCLAWDVKHISLQSLY